jgi:hypothetical protein
MRKSKTGFFFFIMLACIFPGSSVFGDESKSLSEEVFSSDQPVPPPSSDRHFFPERLSRMKDLLDSLPVARDQKSLSQPKVFQVAESKAMENLMTVRECYAKVGATLKKMHSLHTLAEAASPQERGNLKRKTLSMLSEASVSAQRSRDTALRVRRFAAICRSEAGFDAENRASQLVTETAAMIRDMQKMAKTVFPDLKIKREN